MEKKSDYLKNLKRTVLEFVEDISGILTDPIHKVALQALLSNFRVSTEMELMNIAIEWILPIGSQVRARNRNSLIPCFEDFFFKFCGQKISLGKGVEGMDKEEEETMWNYLDVIYALASNYKKNL